MAPASQLSLWSLLLMPTLLPGTACSGQLFDQPEGSEHSTSLGQLLVPGPRGALAGLYSQEEDPGEVPATEHPPATVEKPRWRLRDTNGLSPAGSPSSQGSGKGTPTAWAQHQPGAPRNDSDLPALASPPPSEVELVLQSARVAPGQSSRVGGIGPGTHQRQLGPGLIPAPGTMGPVSPTVQNLHVRTQTAEALSSQRGTGPPRSDKTSAPEPSPLYSQSSPREIHREIRPGRLEAWTLSPQLNVFTSSGGALRTYSSTASFTSTGTPELGTGKGGPAETASGSEAREKENPGEQTLLANQIPTVVSHRELRFASSSGGPWMRGALVSAAPTTRLSYFLLSDGNPTTPRQEISQDQMRITLDRAGQGTQNLAVGSHSTSQAPWVTTAQSVPDAFTTALNPKGPSPSSRAEAFPLPRLSSSRPLHSSRATRGPTYSPGSTSQPGPTPSQHLSSPPSQKPSLEPPVRAWTEARWSRQISPWRPLLGSGPERAFPATSSLQPILSSSELPPAPPHTSTVALVSPGQELDPGTETMEGEPISPQRMRGAVEPPSPPNATTSPSTSAPNLATLAPESPGTRLPAETRPGPRRDQSRPPQPPARSPAPSTTSRRGLIKVTTQRGPRPPAPAASSPSPGCEAGREGCGAPPADETLLRWGPLRRRLSFAWELHVYGAGALFLLLALVALLSLFGAAALRVPARRHVLAADALLLGAGLLRALFLLVDPYGARDRLGARVRAALYNLPFPLLVTAFGILVLVGLRGAGPRAPLPPRWRRPSLLGALGAAHVTALLAVDLLSPLLRPPVHLVVHGLSCAWAAGLALGALLFHLRGLHLGAALWLYPPLGPAGRFSWPWWVVQFWLRLVELAWACTLSFVAARASCQGGGRADHTCWTKLLRYACPPGKSEVPEYPNNCYDRAGGAGAERAGTDVGKSLLRNAAESGPPRAPGDSGEPRAGRLFSSPAGSGLSPKYPTVAPGRSHSSVCLEKTSGLSLSELDLRPPSPINLSRSIDEALFREHLVRDSVFLCSSLQFPGRLARRDSRSSLQEGSAASPAGAPPLAPPRLRQRRCSDPDRPGGLGGPARCSSLADVRGPAPPPDATASGSSLDSFSKGSLKISWNPWRHGLSSLESLPLDELPSTVQLLPAEREPTAVPGPGETGDPDREARRSFLALSKQVDSRSDSSETIEL
ncbi:proline-rich transmembrane protein 3 [Ornithorhynchus anatinus]|uniref:proline-rich transmembrane protein 3 n=1 Tax=Ornithorhynchus anatinus TaxID=9258 RepID=UPI0010A84BEB|nr:proline-rich transmembrane protein 3 [Ornithorhynchus anatinus]